MNPLKTLWVWVCRFRKRKGYGVHSPFAFYLIRAVINEKEAYYAYSELKKQRKGKSVLPEKVDRLLFRLSNYIQPATIVQVGDKYPLSVEYMKEGCKSAASFMLGAEEMLETALEAALKEKPLGLLHLTDVSNNREWFETALKHTSENTLFVIEGIHSGHDKWTWWKEIQQRKEVGITFDLYEVGLIFFDKSKQKQHYKVNFV